MPMTFEELEVGAELPRTAVDIGPEQLVRFAGAVDDYARPHWDHLYMVEQGFEGVIVHGWLTFSVMCRLAGAWLGQDTVELKRFTVRYPRINKAGPAWYGAAVTAKTEQDGVRAAELAVWAEDADGRRVAEGGVTAVFP